MDEQNWKRYFRVFNLFNFSCFFYLIKCNEQDKKTNQPTNHKNRRNEQICKEVQKYGKYRCPGH